MFLKPHPKRGATLLLSHCSALIGERAPAYARLEREVGPGMARMLVFALSGGHGRRGPSSP
jgi:hypothetical protein